MYEIVNITHDKDEHNDYMKYRTSSDFKNFKYKMIIGPQDYYQLGDIITIYKDHDHFFNYSGVYLLGRLGEKSMHRLSSRLSVSDVNMYMTGGKLPSECLKDSCYEVMIKFKSLDKEDPISLWGSTPRS